MELTGLHHVSAVTGNAVANIDFYTQTLGLRLVKKTVNQDDVSSYHLFYGDESGNPGTEVTFFDWRGAAANRPGAGSISGIALSVADADAVDWWASRLHDLKVDHSPVEQNNGFATLDFTDREGQRLQIVGEPAGGRPWSKSPVPSKLGILGMHHVTLTVRHLSTIERVLVGVLGFRQTGEFERDGHPVFVFETGAGGAGKQVHVVETGDHHIVRLGAGGVHHVAFRTPNIAEQVQWLDRVRSSGLNASGLVDRFYFNSIYFREPGGILFEIATDGPGFATDENIDHLGEGLSLPPFLEPNRESIEAGLVPL